MTSQITPISMLAIVMAERIRKAYRRAKARYCSCVMKSATRSEMESKRVPCKKRLCMDRKTPGKVSEPTREPRKSWVNPMPKTYRTMTNSSNVKPTDRIAAAIAFTKISSSGTIRSKRAIRKSRDRRMSLAKRRMEALERRPLLVPAPVTNSTAVMTQVSKTIVMTKRKSNTNQASLRQFRLALKARNRMTSSTKKYKQNICSATKNTASACKITSARFKSVSTAIHIA
mmetsp:Transcript_125856/g.298771  ORF Transcript_125856/g.298771 Transcript_125856/m.298771 type:complete len:229 (+) Transcript_125856:532-1218(+)